MLDIVTLDKYDTEQLYKIYDDWPNLAKKTFDSDLISAKFENIDHIVFAGMGGSGAVGDLFASILSKTNIPVSYTHLTLPKTSYVYISVVAVSL